MMKKFFYVILFVFLFSMTLMGCSSYDLNTEESTIQAVVTECKENITLNYAYENLAQQYADNYAKHNYYMKLAVENATYTYTLSVNIDGRTYKFVRSEPVNVGDTIDVIKIETSYEGQIIDTEYK